MKTPINAGPMQLRHFACVAVLLTSCGGNVRVEPTDESGAGGTSPAIGGGIGEGGAPTGGRNGAGGRQTASGGRASAPSAADAGNAGGTPSSAGGAPGTGGVAPDGGNSLATCQTISTKPMDLNPCGYVKGLAFTPDGEFLVVAVDEPPPNVHVYRLSDGTLVRDLYGAEGGALCSVLSPDGKRVAVCGRATGRHLPVARVHDLASGRALFAVADRPAPIRMTFSSDGSRIAVTGEGYELWNAADGAFQVSLPRSIPFFDIQFSPVDPRWLLATGDGRSVVLDVTTLEEHGLGEDETVAAAFSPDGRFIASVTSANQVQLRAASDGQVLHQTGAPFGDPGLDRIVWLTPELFVVLEWGSGISVWRVESGSALVLSRTIAASFDQGLAAAPDGKTIAVGFSDGVQPPGFVFVSP